MDFNEKVLTLVSQIPKGKVTTYKILAERLKTKAYRAVGQALKNNPSPIKVPCHRVVKTSLTIGGYKGKTSGPAIQQKIYLLKKEGIIIKNNKIPERFIFRF